MTHGETADRPMTAQKREIWPQKQPSRRGLPGWELEPQANEPVATGSPAEPERADGGAHEVPLRNRVRDIALHISWYGFKTQARLAQDSGVSPAAISRLIRGQSQPSLAIALRVTQALSKRLNKPLDVSEVFSLDGCYATASVCLLVGCRACLPPEAYDGDENLKPQYQGVKAGQWSLAEPNPFRTDELPAQSETLALAAKTATVEAPQAGESHDDSSSPTGSARKGRQ